MKYQHTNQKYWFNRYLKLTSHNYFQNYRYELIPYYGMRGKYSFSILNGDELDEDEKLALRGRLYEEEIPCSVWPATILESKIVLTGNYCLMLVCG